jgi:hypothetical protein
VLFNYVNTLFSDFLIPLWCISGRVTGDFFKGIRQSMCPGLTQTFEMSTRIFLGVKTAGA